MSSEKAIYLYDCVMIINCHLCGSPVTGACKELIKPYTFCCIRCTGESSYKCSRGSLISNNSARCVLACEERTCMSCFYDIM